MLGSGSEPTARVSATTETSQAHGMVRTVHDAAERKREQTEGVQAWGRRHVLREVHVLYPCWERSVHTLLVTGARLCFCTRDGATTGAVRPVVLGHTLTHGRRIHTRCLAYRGKGTSLKPGEGSEGVGCCPSCTCIGGRSSLRPCYSTRSDQVPGPITSSMVQGSSVPAVGKLLGDPVTVYPLLPAHNKPRIHGQQVGRAASARRE